MSGAGAEGAALYQDAQARAREQLLRASAALQAEGIPGTEARGQLIRPVVGLASLRDSVTPPPRFWEAVLAVQLAHEASLVHDDIVDSAPERRGVATEAASSGVASALLLGDHLLTAAFRASARTGQVEFVSLFARAVERTVAAEAEQARMAGTRLGVEAYDRIALGKAGELMGCALAAAPVLEGRGDAAELFELGRRLGRLYQHLDDLLDYCPHAPTGKAALSDYQQRRWTWLLDEVPDLGFGRDPADVVEVLHSGQGGTSPIRRALSRLEDEIAALRDELAIHLPADPLIPAMLAEWRTRAREAIDREGVSRPPLTEGPASRPLAERRRCSPGAVEMRVLQARVPPLAGVERYLASHSRSFRFACRFFPRAQRARVARVYAYCRITDDLTDLPPASCASSELLDLWLKLSRAAYGGEPSRLPLLDQVMLEMAEAGASIEYAAELVEGMRMDLRGERYPSLTELRRYTYRVASVVGLWLSRLCGVSDPRILSRAERMGHAMQLTNILRDVGEDWDRGRLYLPADLLRVHGLAEDDLAMMRAGAPISGAYQSGMESLMEIAEADYRAALEAVPALPAWFARPVAIAAHVYRGIHNEIRRNGYDNLRQRAYTRRIAKGFLAARALRELHRAPALAMGEAIPAVGFGGGGE